MKEFTPNVMQDINSKLQTHDHTYYFSISTSVKDFGQKSHCKKIEVLSEPGHTSRMGAGFDLDSDLEVKYRNSAPIKPLSWVE